MTNCQKRKVDELPAGTELDLLVALHVMHIMEWPSLDWKPSTDIAAVWEVLDAPALATRILVITCTNIEAVTTRARWDASLTTASTKRVTAQGETAQLALSRVVLKAVGVEEV